MQVCDSAKERKEKKDWKKQRRRMGLKGWNIWRTHNYPNTDDTTVATGDNVPEAK